MREVLDLTIQGDWLTVEEAADYLRVSRATLYRYCERGQLRYYTLAGKGGRRFRRQELAALLVLNGTRGDVGTADELSAATDPVLAELWDNPDDAAYDRYGPS